MLSPLYPHTNFCSLKNGSSIQLFPRESQYLLMWIQFNFIVFLISSFFLYRILHLSWKWAFGLCSLWLLTKTILRLSVFSCDKCWDFNRSRPKTTSTWVAYVDAIKFAKIGKMINLTLLQIKRGVHIIVRMVKMVVCNEHPDAWWLPTTGLCLPLLLSHAKVYFKIWLYHTNNQILFLHLDSGDIDVTNLCCKMLEFIFLSMLI